MSLFHLLCKSNKKVTILPHIPKENHIFALNLGTKTRTDE